MMSRLAGNAEIGMPIAEQDRILPSDGESDLDMFRDRLNAAYYPAFVDTPGGNPVLAYGRLNAKALDSTTVGFVRFGRQAVVDPGTIDGYHINVPVAGRIDSHCGEKNVLARPGTAAIFTPNGATRLSYISDDAAQICVKISRSAVVQELEALLGRPATAPLEMAIEMPLTSALGWAWTRSFWNLVETAGAAEIARPVTSYLERAMIGQLLFTANHNYRDALEAPTATAVPQTVRRVLDLIESSPERLFTAADLAREGGVGVRRLEQAFREHVGMSPSAYLSRKRHERAHADLLKRDTQETVTTVMYRWGFSNHARFAEGYRRLFGENPSTTLRRVRNP